MSINDDDELLDMGIDPKQIKSANALRIIRDNTFSKGEAIIALAVTLDIILTLIVLVQVL